MKPLNIILLVLIVIGLGLLLTQKTWVPPLVSFIIAHDGRPEPAPGASPSPETPTTTPNSFAGWHFEYSPVSPQGIQFQYPNPLPTTYVTAPQWPPVVEMTAGEFVCTEGETVELSGVPAPQKQQMIGDREYCVVATSEGAAGSVFTTYRYTTQQGDFLPQVTFTLRTPQCLNYDEPQQNACTSEQAGFDADGLVDRIVSSIKVP